MYMLDTKGLKWYVQKSVPWTKRFIGDLQSGTDILPQSGRYYYSGTRKTYQLHKDSEVRIAQFKTSVYITIFKPYGASGYDSISDAQRFSTPEQKEDWLKKNYIELV